CCYGVMPRMNEWVHVKMAPGKKAKFAIHVPLVAYGTLAVGEQIEDGIVMSLYRMESTEVTEPPLFR
ncbi:MAG: hypothetical protein ACREID_03790, partial [Planctomycetota bacterium]